MEIERKYLVSRLPDQLDSYEYHEIEQAYLSVAPVVRVRKADDTYYLTYKGAGMLAREEYNLPLTEESYRHLLEKHDGKIITKRRYLIPLTDELTIELDLFSGYYEGLVLAEVEFPDLASANTFTPPDWFGEDVTFDGRYHNSYMALSEE